MAKGEIQCHDSVICTADFVRSLTDARVHYQSYKGSKPGYHTLLTIEKLHLDTKQTANSLPTLNPPRGRIPSIRSHSQANPSTLHILPSHRGDPPLEQQVAGARSQARR